MLAFSPRQRHWSVGVLAPWWRRWTGARATELLEIARLGAGEVGHLTQDGDQSASDFGAPVSRSPDEANLLGRRMVAVDLDPYELSLSEPALSRHLQRRCALCESRERCARDLAREAADPAWQEYCPNAATLNALRALHNHSRAVPKFVFPYLG